MIDRQMQREILLQLSQVYPQAIAFEDDDPTERYKLAANLVYLSEHAMVTGEPQVGLDGHIHFQSTVITARGLDFITDDGGLSAILQTVTIKLHADTILDLIAGQIDALHTTQAEKRGLTHILGSLSGKGLEAATSELMKLGIVQLPELATWLQKFVGL